VKNPYFFTFCAILFAAAIALAGCNKKREIVSIPTPAPCVKAADIPVEPERVQGKLTRNAKKDSAILAVSNLDLRDWGGKLRALLRGCE
jgi:hypothetical protein